MRLAVRGDRSQEIPPVGSHRRFVAQQQARSEFEEFVEAIEGRRWIGVAAGVVRRELLLLGRESEATFLEYHLVDNAIQVRVGEAIEARLDCLHLHRRVLPTLVLDDAPVRAQLVRLGFQIALGIGRELHAHEERAELSVDHLLTQACRRAARGLAAVVDVALVPRGNQRVAAGTAGDETREVEGVRLYPSLRAPMQHILHTIEQAA